MMGFLDLSPTPLGEGRAHHTASRPIARNSRYPQHIWRLFAVVFLLAGVCVAEDPDLTIEIGQTGPPVEIVRCHFDEGRLVVRYDEGLHVLHKDDTIESIGLRLLEISSDGATISIRQTQPRTGLRLIRVTNAGLGTLLLREFTTDPAGIGAGSRSSQTSVRSATGRE